jgi:hypothetical protein
MPNLSAADLILATEHFLDLDDQLRHFDSLGSELELLVGPKKVPPAFSMLRFNQLLLIPHTIRGNPFRAATCDMKKSDPPIIIEWTCLIFDLN